MSYLRGEIILKEIKVRNVAIPQLVINSNMNFRDIDKNMNNVKLLTRKAVLLYKGDPISYDESSYYSEGIDGNRIVSMTFNMPITQEIVKLIERNREDDLTLHLRVDFLYSYRIPQSEHLDLNTTYLDLEISLSQRKWTDLLKELGYWETWHFEVRRADIEGMETVKNHLAHAGEALIDTNYDGCISEVRAALNSFKPLLDGSWESLSSFIDEGSKGETDRDPVSTRIKSLHKDLRALANAGQHKEAYLVSPEEVRLCYYQTVSLISYFSKIMAKEKLVCANEHYASS